jgi:hypothetical protein
MPAFHSRFLNFFDKKSSLPPLSTSEKLCNDGEIKNTRCQTRCIDLRQIRPNRTPHRIEENNDIIIGATIKEGGFIWVESLSQEIWRVAV